MLGTNRDGRINFTSLFSAGHKQKWRPYPVNAQPASYQVDVMADNVNKFPSKCFDIFSLCPGCVQIFLKKTFFWSAECYKAFLPLLTIKTKDYFFSHFFLACSPSLFFLLDVQVVR